MTSVAFVTTEHYKAGPSHVKVTRFNSDVAELFLDTDRCSSVPPQNRRTVSAGPADQTGCEPEGRLIHEREVPDEAWRYGLYRTDDRATDETQIYPPTMPWSNLQKICYESSGTEVPAAMSADPILLLLFVNIFPFRASFSAMKFLHKEFD